MLNLWDPKLITAPKYATMTDIAFRHMHVFSTLEVVLDDAELKRVDGTDREVA